MRPSAASCRGGRALRANPLGLPIGSQTLPSPREIKDGNFAGLLKGLASSVFGARALFAAWVQRVCQPADGKQVRKIIADHGPHLISVHFSMRTLREKQPQCIAWAGDVGITPMITASLGGNADDG